MNYGNNQFIVQKHYYPNNVLRLEIPMKNGQKHGIQREHYESGQVK